MPDVLKSSATSRSANKRKNAIGKSSMLANARPSGNPLSSFCLLPNGVGFDVQHDNEQILLFLRQHFIVNVGWIVLSVFLALLPSVFGFTPVLSFLPFIPPMFTGIFIFGWYLFIFGFVLERFIVWYYNVCIVTDERVVDVDFYSLLFKRVSEARLEHVEDITGASGGVLQSFFDYGDVLIQTAAEIPEIEFSRVPHPDQVAKLISELIDKEEEGKGRNT